MFSSLMLPTSVHSARRPGRRIGNVPIMGLFGGGNTFYVSSTASGASNSNPGTKARPWATLASAVGDAAVTASNGDVIFVMPNHAETVTGVGGITISKAGLTIVGLGSGRQRPSFSCDGGTTVTIAVTGADTRIINLDFNAGHAAVVTCLDVDADGFTLENCLFRDGVAADAGGVGNFLACIESGSTTDNVCDDMSLFNNLIVFETATSLNFLHRLGHQARLKIVGNRMFSVGSQATSAFVLDTSGDDVEMGIVANNVMRNATTSGANLFWAANDQTDNTGFLIENHMGGLDAAAAAPFVIAGLGYVENYYTGATAETEALLLPVV